MTDKRTSETPVALDGPPPLFSIVVPVYEQWDLLPTLLACFQEQMIGQEALEFILVDNGSAIVDIGCDVPSNCKILSCKSPGSYAARNFGAAQARGDWLVFTDADCRPAPGWLAGLHQEITRRLDNAMVFVGAVDVVPAAAPPSLYEIYDMVRGIPQARYVRRGYGATANLAVPKEQFQRLGGFDESRFSGGDADFCRRARESGLGITYAGGAIVAHPARRTWQELATKARRVKGGQLAAGSARRRLLWSAVTLIPPFRECYYLLRNRQYPPLYRFLAVAVQHRLWLVEIRELFRLLMGERPERR